MDQQEKFDLIKKFETFDSDDIISVINKMVEGKEVGLKSEFVNPIAVSQGRLFAKYCEQSGYKLTAELMNKMVAFYENDMVSYKRESRKEVERMVSSVIQREQGMKDRLLGREDRDKR